jgi:hypothetical protein
MREYAANECLDVPLCSTNLPMMRDFAGQTDEFAWTITGLQITKAPLKANEPANHTHSEADRMLRRLEEILRLGATDAIKPGTFVWSNTTFTAKLADYVEKVVVDGVPVQHIAGKIALTNQEVACLSAWGQYARYQYAGGTALPRWFPSTILVGFGEAGLHTRYVVEELTFGSHEEVMRLVDPDAFFRDPAEASLVLASRGRRTVLRGTDMLGPADNGESEKRLAVLRLAFALVIVAFPVVLAVCLRFKKRPALGGS